MRGTGVNANAATNNNNNVNVSRGRGRPGNNQATTARLTGIAMSMWNDAPVSDEDMQFFNQYYLPHVPMYYGHSRNNNNGNNMTLLNSLTFLFLGRIRFKALKDHYVACGLQTRVHGNTKRLPYNTLTFREKENVLKFIRSYARANAILLPGRIPGYKRDDLQLLPSCTTKKASGGIHSK